MSRRRGPRAPIRLNALDRAIGFFAPQRAVLRGAARFVLSAASGYAGARRDRSATKGWAAKAGASADYETLPDLDILRARSRDLVRNDPLARSAVTTKVVNVIGPGHVLRPEVDADRLGLTPELAEEWEALALDIWTDWAWSTDCDITRHQTFAELEDLVYRSRLQSGDCFVVRRFKTRKGRLLATALQVIEADRLSNPNWAADTETLAGGVEMDADGAPIAYHFADRYALDRHGAGAPTWTRVPAYDANGRKLVLHIHGPRERPDMTRYVPMLAPVIEGLKQRSRYTEAELMAAVVSAIFAIATKSEDGDLSEALARLATSKGAATADKSEITLTEPGLVYDLMPGEEVQNFAPNRPNPQFGSFIDAVAREVGAGTDLPFELLVKQFQASYSASRAAMEMAWQFFRADRELHVSQFCAPVYEDVITEAVARGLLKAPGLLTNPLRRQAWLGAAWMGPARPTIDPVKDATADEKYLDMGVTSLTRVAAERFGTDYRTVRRRRALDGTDEREASRAPAPAQGPAEESAQQSDDDKTDGNDQEKPDAD
ncbi:phage portal protein [Pararhodobacter aggregans]|uniref:phage portal protein n=1 Tax=Pararhodobacter aggregans TaxID=404875 RepID=UPI003A937471